MAIYSMTGFARAQARVSTGGEEQLSYTLTVKSVPGRGTVVTLEWPQKPARAVATVVSKVMVGNNVQNSSTSH